MQCNAATQHNLKEATLGALALAYAASKPQGTSRRAMPCTGGWVHTCASSQLTLASREAMTPRSVDAEGGASSDCLRGAGRLSDAALSAHARLARLMHGSAGRGSPTCTTRLDHAPPGERSTAACCIVAYPCELQGELLRANSITPFCKSLCGINCSSSFTR